MTSALRVRNCQKVSWADPLNSLNLAFLSVTWGERDLLISAVGTISK